MNLQMSSPRSSNLTIFSNPVARLRLSFVEPDPSPKGHFVLTFMLNYPNVVWVWLCVVWVWLCVVCVWVGCWRHVWGVCGVCGCRMGGWCVVGWVVGGGSLVAQTVKHLPTMQETRVWSLGREGPLEKDLATHSSTRAWKNPMDGGVWWATVHGVANSWTLLSNFTWSWSQ